MEKVVNGWMLKMEEQEDVVHIKIIVLVKNVPKKNKKKMQKCSKN